MNRQFRDFQGVYNEELRDVAEIRNVAVFAKMILDYVGPIAEGCTESFLNRSSVIVPKDDFQFVEMLLEASLKTIKELKEKAK
jgi:hypothetical protein